MRCSSSGISAGTDDGIISHASCSVTFNVKYILTAIPMESKPGPRLAELAGTFTIKLVIARQLFNILFNSLLVIREGDRFTFLLFSDGLRIFQTIAGKNGHHFTSIRDVPCFTLLDDTGDGGVGSRFSKYSFRFREKLECM